MILSTLCVINRQITIYEIKGIIVDDCVHRGWQLPTGEQPSESCFGKVATVMHEDQGTGIKKQEIDLIFLMIEMPLSPGSTYRVLDN